LRNSSPLFHFSKKRLKIATPTLLSVNVGVAILEARTQESRKDKEKDICALAW
jgi:hypothetical protein